MTHYTFSIYNNSGGWYEDFSEYGREQTYKTGEIPILWESGLLSGHTRQVVLGYRKTLSLTLNILETSVARKLGEFLKQDPLKIKYTSMETGDEVEVTVRAVSTAFQHLHEIRAEYGGLIGWVRPIDLYFEEL